MMVPENQYINERRNRLVTTTVVAVSSIFFLYTLFWFFVGSVEVGYVSGATAVVMLLTLFIPRNLNNIQLRANINLSVVCLSLLISTLMTFESSETVIYWLFLMPLGALIFFGEKWMYFWSILLVVVVMTIPYIVPHFPFKVEFSPRWLPLVKWVQLSSIMIANVAMLFVYRNLIFDTVKGLTRKGRELNQTTEELRAAQKYKDQFFANMGHELRTPLNAILGISELLESSDQENQELVNHLKNSSNNLLAVINDLMDFSKMRENKVKLSSMPYDFRSILQSAYDLVKVMAMEKNVRYTLHIDDDVPREVVGDPNRLTQALVNVLNNAIKYTPTGQEVKISCKLDTTKVYTEGEAHIEVCVEDTGIGIHQDDMDKIFEDYFRGKEACKEEITGTGLGLYITKFIIDAMGGEILVSSQLNKGTTVRLLLDLKLTSTKKLAPAPSEDQPFQFEDPLNILLVDDSKLNLVVAQKQLHRIISEDSVIHTAENGLEAIQILKHNAIDIVLMDMQMPVMDGIEATRSIRSLEDEHKRKVPIIIITANLGIKDTDPCLESGANAIIGKPFSIYTVSKKMQELLKEYSLMYALIGSFLYIA